MAKKITDRTKQIAKILLQKNEMTLEQLSQMLGISVRQARYDLQCMNNMLEKQGIINIVETDNKGKIIIHDIHQLSKILDIEEVKLSQQQRINVLKAITALNVGKMNLTQLAKEMEVSRMTIKGDLKLLETILESYHLQLDYKKNFYLIGSANHLYKYRQDVVYLFEYTLYKTKLEKTEQIMETYILDCFGNKRLRQVLKMIYAFLQENKQSIDDSKLYWFASTILLYIWYEKNGQKLPQEKNEQNNIQGIIFDTLFQEIETYYEIQLCDNARQRIVFSFSLICNQSTLKTVDLDIVTYLIGLVQFLKDYSFHHDQDYTFFNELYHHLERCCRLNQSGIEIHDFEQYYENLDADVEARITQYCQSTMLKGRYLSKEEMGFLKIYFSNLFYKRQDAEKRVLLVCGTSENIKERLSQDIKKLFHVQIVKILSKFELTFFHDWESIDLILFTSEIPDSMPQYVPMSKIHVNVTDEDYIQLVKLNLIPKMQEIEAKNYMSNEINKISFKEQLEKMTKTSLFEHVQCQFGKKINTKGCGSYKINEHIHCFYKYDRKEQCFIYEDKENEKVMILITSSDPTKLIQRVLYCCELDYI